jgi:SAM-dependent methyltransferase
MCNVACITFVAKSLEKESVRGKRILEVGARGYGVRQLLESWGPAQYIGVDVAPGPGVDVVRPIEEVAPDSVGGAFDLVVATEMLEHSRDWQAAISSMKRLCRGGGLLLLTTRSRGFPFHAPPHDFWRFEPEDFRAIFSDCEILSIEADGTEPGVFVLARKPHEFTERELGTLPVYSILLRKRTCNCQGPEFEAISVRVRHASYSFLALVDQLYRRIRRRASDYT